MMTPPVYRFVHRGTTPITNTGSRTDIPPYARRMPPDNPVLRFRSLLAWVSAFALIDSPDWRQRTFEEITRPLFDRPEIREVMEGLGLTARDMVRNLLDHEVEILESQQIEVSYLPDLRGWFQDLSRAAWSESVEEVSEKSVATVGGILIALVASLVLVPSLLFLYLFIAGLCVAGLYLLTGQNHVKARFSEPSLGLLRENVVLPLMRKHLNDLLRGSNMDEPFHVDDTSTLNDLTEPDHLVSTEAIRMIEQTNASLGYGSIGVSGPRGVGKSTLLKSFCENRFTEARQRDLRILIPAPMQYEARDFVIHVFGHLCEAVMVSNPKPIRAHWASRSATVLSVLLVLLGGLLLLWSRIGVPVGKEDALMWGRHLALYFLGPTTVVFVFGTILVRRLVLTVTSKHRRERGQGPFEIRIGEVLAPSLSGGVLAALLATGIAWWVGPPSQTRPDYSQLSSPVALGVALAFSGMALGLTTYLLRIRSRRRRQRLTDLPSLARRWLERLRFLETTTTGITGSFQMTKPVQISGSRNKALAEQQMGLPQLVSEYRRFATLTARWWNERHEGKGRLVIGIDEIDKMPPDEAEKFINQVKALFGTENCLTLVSVSDDALTNFEQRAFSVRDAFDTAFDDIVRVEPLDHSAVHELLTRRVSGVPDTYVALCYVLSGGLPRECLRVARTMVRFKHGSSSSVVKRPFQTADFAKELVRREVEVLKKALLARGLPQRPAPEAESTGLPVDQDVRGVFLDDWPVLTAEELLRIGDQWWREADSLSTYAAQFRFLGAVLRLFCDERRRIGGLLREQESATGPLLGLLARARVVGAQSPHAQMLLVEEFLERWEEAPFPAE